LGHLHHQHLVHRDIKPSNIIFVNGRAKIADLGLVTDVRNTTTLGGTVGYLPEHGPGTPSADLYSLGKVLYEMRTGKDRLEYPVLPTDVDLAGNLTAMRQLNEIILGLRPKPRACFNPPSCSMN
jgi:serine/threonine protein kinase